MRGVTPAVDIEPLRVRTAKYGLVEFQKVAVQIWDAKAELVAWSVYLNVTRVEQEQKFWADLQDRLSAT